MSKKSMSDTQEELCEETVSGVEQLSHIQTILQEYFKILVNNMNENSATCPDQETRHPFFPGQSNSPGTPTFSDSLMANPFLINGATDMMQQILLQAIASQNAQFNEIIKNQQKQLAEQLMMQQLLQFQASSMGTQLPVLMDLARRSGVTNWMGASIPISSTEALLKIGTNEWPLDLSTKNEHSNTPSESTTIDVVGTFDTSAKGSPNESKDSSGSEDSSSSKRGYSQRDLHAAVEEIRSGRLGTRRASVVFGIPRSTLRNKIYKLEAGDDSSSASSSRKQRVEGQSTEKGLGDEAERKYHSTSPQLSVSSTPRPSQPDSRECSKTPPPNMPQADDSTWNSTDFWHSFVRSQPQVHETELCSSALTSARTVELRTKQHGCVQMPNGDWKKTRPKRGQYRKYDKDALEQAVICVRRGEMSVHRAGSYFGVPHSTLEYKVKERNLNRQKRQSIEHASSVAS